jgi:hypothetical protein
VTSEQRAARAVSIRALLDDPNIKDAFASIEADISEEWRRTFDPAERENLWRAINIMDRLKTWLVSNSSLTEIKRAK